MIELVRLGQQQVDLPSGGPGPLDQLLILRRNPPPDVDDQEQADQVFTARQEFDQPGPLGALDGACLGITITRQVDDAPARLELEEVQ